MLPKRVMLCVEDVRAAQDYKDAVGALVRKLGATLVLYHASRPRALDGSGRTPDPAYFDSLVGDPAFASIDVMVEHSVTPFDIVADITRLAEEKKIDWLLMPTHARQGIDRLIFGSLTERAIRSCKWPVFAFEIGSLHEKEDVRFDQVIVPIDFSPLSEAALPYAQAIADKFRCPLTLVHVVEDYYTTAYPLTDLPFVMEYRPQLVDSTRVHLERIAGKITRPAGLETRVVAVPGTLVQVMQDTAATTKHPLSVLATAGHSSLVDRVLGSNAERLLRRLHGSVLALPKVVLDRTDKMSDT